MLDSFKVILIIDFFYKLKLFEIMRIYNVFHFKLFNLVYYGYGDFLTSILSSILSKSTCLAKIQALLSNYIRLRNILLSEWLGK